MIKRVLVHKIKGKDKISDRYGNAKLFHILASERVLIAFSPALLAAGKLPLAGKRTTLFSQGDKHLPVS